MTLLAETVLALIQERLTRYVPFVTAARRVVSDRLPRAPMVKVTAYTGRPTGPTSTGVTGHCEGTEHSHPAESSVVCCDCSAPAAAAADLYWRMNSWTVGESNATPAEPTADPHSETKNEPWHGS